MVGCLFYVTMPACVPMIMDLLIPLNSSREKQWILYGEYLIDKDNHYYKIYLLEAACSWASVFMILSIDAIYIGCIHHCVALIGVLK